MKVSVSKVECVYCDPRTTSPCHSLHSCLSCILPYTIDPPETCFVSPQEALDKAAAAEKLDNNEALIKWLRKAIDIAQEGSALQSPTGLLTANAASLRKKLITLLQAASDRCDLVALQRQVPFG